MCKARILRRISRFPCLGAAFSGSEKSSRSACGPCLRNFGCSFLSGALATVQQIHLFRNAAHQRPFDAHRRGSVRNPPPIFDPPVGILPGKTACAKYSSLSGWLSAVPFHHAGSPHGARLRHLSSDTVAAPADESVSLELPEIFSSCRL